MANNKKKKKLPWQKWLFTMVLLSVGGVCGYAIASYMDRMATAGQSMGSGLISLGLLLLGFLAVVVLCKGYMGIALEKREKAQKEAK